MTELTIKQEYKLAIIHSGIVQSAGNPTLVAERINKIANALEKDDNKENIHTLSEQIEHSLPEPLSPSLDGRGIKEFLPTDGWGEHYYYYPGPNTPDYYLKKYWRGDKSDYMLLNRGRIHAVKEYAILHGKAEAQRTTLMKRGNSLWEI